MKTKILVILVLACLGLLTSCRKKIDNPLRDPLPALRNTVFTAKTANGESYISRITQNYTNEIPPRYLAKHKFENEDIEVGYQYVGKGIVNDMSKIDVYLISIKMGSKPSEHIAITYSGGDKVVVDQAEIQVAFSQGQDAAND